jgi:hypothetical protein
MIRCTFGAHDLMALRQGSKKISSWSTSLSMPRLAAAAELISKSNVVSLLEMPPSLIFVVVTALSSLSPVMLRVYSDYSTWQNDGALVEANDHCG